MCGISGIFALEDRTFPVDALSAMNATLVHRGPDDEGRFADAQAGLAMRRLSIIGLSNGHQPIFNEDRTLALVMNGEIYNYPELKAGLREHGHRFSTDSDAEVAVHLYEERGLDFLDELRGMFALALYDQPRRALIVARDRAGKKPLYYATRDGLLLFASEVKALHASGLLPKELDADALDSYLAYGFVAGERTLFAQVRKLPAGCVLLAGNGMIATRRYWDLPRPAANHPTLPEAAARVRTLLERAVERRLMSEVPLGAFLSGGVDSSAVVACMARQLGRPVQTFSVGFDHSEFDELVHARAVAHRFGTEHHELVVDRCTPQLLRQINWHHDEPAADPASVPTFCLSHFARRHVTVVLTGEGGDETFAGYPHYELCRRLMQLEQRVPGLGMVARSLDHLEPYVGHLGPHRFWKGMWIASLAAADRPRAWLSAFTDTELDRLRGRDGRTHDARRREIIQLLNGHAGDADWLTQLLYLDSHHCLADHLLMKVDKMTMAASLEARCPLLDTELIEYAAALPIDLKLSQHGSKLVFRAALDGLVPPDILARPKHGFDVPIRLWLLRDLAGLAHDLLLGSDAATGRYLDLRSVRSLWARLERRDDARVARQLWTLLNLAVWHEQHWPIESGHRWEDRDAQIGTERCEARAGL